MNQIWLPFSRGLTSARGAALPRGLESGTGKQTRGPSRWSMQVMRRQREKSAPGAWVARPQGLDLTHSPKQGLGLNSQKRLSRQAGDR